MAIVKIGNVELTPNEALRYYQEGKYIVNYAGVYQLHYSAAQRAVYGSRIYSSRGMARRGRFYALDAESVNRLVGFPLVREEP